jgi:hypothetical protein
MTAAAAGQMAAECGPLPRPAERLRPVRGYASGKEDYLRRLRKIEGPPAWLLAGGQATAGGLGNRHRRALGRDRFAGKLPGPADGGPGCRAAARDRRALLTAVAARFC